VILAQRVRWLWHRFTLGRTALPAIASYQSAPGSHARLAMHLRDAVRDWIQIGTSAEVVHRHALDVPADEVRIVIETARTL
jgi:hypothetical protein